MFIGKRRTGMGKWMTRSFLTALAVFVLSLMTAAPAAAQGVQITLLHISDTHSHLAAWGPKDGNLDGTLGGLPKAAAIVAMERATDPNALLVHAGDVMEGDFFFNEYLGVPDFQLLKSIGLDVLVFGNHEYRFGPDFLVSVLQAAWPDSRVPIVCSNLDPQGHPLGSWFTSTLIKDVNGVKVGFFGLTNKGAPANLGTLKFIKITYPFVQMVVDSLRGAGAQVVVCLSHNGVTGAQGAQGIAANVSGIDVIVNGHDDAVLEQPEQLPRAGGGTTLVISAGHLYRYVGRLRLSVAGSEVSMVDYSLLSVDADTPSSPAVQAAVDALKPGIIARYGDVYHTPLAWAEEEITLDWAPHGAKRDTALGNLLTDAYRAKTGTDIALEPFAYIGDPLLAGTIVGADLFRAMSYGDLEPDPNDPDRRIVAPWRLVTFRLSGSMLKGMLETFLGLGGAFFPQVSGLRFDYDSRSGMILLGTMRVQGHLVLPDQLYSMTVTKGIFDALGLPPQAGQMLPDTAFEAIRDLVISRGQLGLATSNRIRDVAAIPRRVRLTTLPGSLSGAATVKLKR